MNSNNLPAAQQALPAIDYSKREVVETLKQTVAKGATDAELALFIEHCKGTGLNPFKRETWFIKTQAGVQIMTGINGFYEIANRHPQFDGLEVETVEDAGKLVKAIARCYRKDRGRPTVAEAYLSEYGKSYGNWKTMPRLMLSKCAESMALRKSFPQELNGIYSAEEMPTEYAAPGEPAAAPAVKSPAAEPPPVVRHYYDISAIPEGDGKRGRAAAVELLSNSGAVPLGVDKTIWECFDALKPLANREISKDEAHKRAAGQGTDYVHDVAKDNAAFPNDYNRPVSHRESKEDHGEFWNPVKGA